MNLPEVAIVGTGAFVKVVKKMRVVAGWNARCEGRALSKRLAVPVSKKRAR